MDTGFQQVESNKFLITIPEAESINHVVLFLTGITPLPSNMASCIFFTLPYPHSSPTWRYLGYLTNEKPSSIYKLTNLAQSRIRNGMTSDTSPQFDYTQSPVLHVAQIGISIEPMDSVLQMVPAIETVASKADTFTQFVNKTVGNLYNYCSSFSRPVNEIIGESFQTQHNNTQFVPITTIQNWYENYTRRLSKDQNFWKNLN